MSTPTEIDRTPVDDGIIEELRGRVAGAVLGRDSAGYVEACTGYNLAAVRRPDVVVRAADAEDVAEAVAAAAAHGLPVSVMSTGHQAGRPIEGGVLILTSALRGVRIDAEARRARVGAGARWQDVLDASLPLGLAPLHGSSPLVGVVGFTLGGGISPTMGRAHGFAVDHVTALQVVTADGRAVDVSADREPDLFWALRGGRAGFGVVTAIELELFEVGAFAGGGVFFDGEHAAAVLEAFRALTEGAPDELSTSLALLRMPPLPGIPPLLAGRFVLHLRVAYLGDAADVDALLEPLRGAAPVLLDTVGALPYEQFASIHADPVDPAPFTEGTAALRELTECGIATLLAVAGPDAGPAVEIIELRHLGGAMGRPVAAPGAIDLHDARYVLWTAVIGMPGDRPESVRDAEAVVQALAPWSAEQQYLNFAAEDVPADRLYAPDALHRLRTIAAATDPDHRFGFPHPTD